MQCPFCDASSTRVVDSRKRGEQVHRRRRCEVCRRSFNSLERLKVPAIRVRKRSGIREPFDEDKLRKALGRALHGHPHAAEHLGQAMDFVLRSLVRMGMAEIQWRQLANLVAEALGREDALARSRFNADYYILQEAGERLPEEPAEKLDAQLNFNFKSGAPGE